MATLGDVPGLDALVSTTDLLASDYAVLEDGETGEFSDALGDITTGMGSGDPFAVSFGFLDDEADDSEAAEGSWPAPQPNDPMTSAYMPTYGSPAPAQPDLPADAVVTHGSFKGKAQYDLTEYDGKTVDNMTAAALDAAAKALGSGFHVMQGSHNAGGVAASGGTHDGGGVIDIAPQNGDWEGAVEALRKIGFAAWVRNAPGHGSAGSGEHIHAVLIGNEQLSPQAQTQVQSYLNNDDGLAGSRPDDGPRQYVNNRFVWGETQKASEPSKVDRLRATVLRQAKQLIGTPFKWGGEDVDGTDVEGFLKQTYGKLGVETPRIASNFWDAAATVPIAQAKPGDLIAWHGDNPGLGLYLGKNQLIEVGGPGRVVQISEATQADAFGVPMDEILRRSSRSAAPRPLNRPAPAQAPMHTEVRPGTSVTEPHASIKPKPKKPKGDGVFSGGTTFNQKPKGGALSGG